MSFDEEEEKLCVELKKICYANGREKDPKRSAFILNELGENQRRRYQPSKQLEVKLLKSAILLNAAITREPDNVDVIKLNRRKLYEDVLKFANVEGISADDLISQASEFFTRVKRLREAVDEKLEFVSKISTKSFGKRLINKEKDKIKKMQNIQNRIFRCYKKLMHDIMCYCIEVKGSVPCEYALAGMGSLARKEITPYSDFESVIVLEDDVQIRSDREEILEYFRWVAVLFQIILITFGETIVPLANISKLSWFYDVQTRGISPDGYVAYASKNPLGRQECTEKKPWITELIKPVSKMLEYLESETDLKNGYHLADVLTKTCFVAGNNEVYETFRKGVKEKKQDLCFNENFIDLIKEDAYNFNISKIMFDMFYNDLINVKRTIYRGISLFVAAMGHLYRIDSLNPFEVVGELVKNCVVGKEDAHKFKYAIAVACEIRLKIYAFAQSQHDEVTEYFPRLTDLVGLRSTFDFFFIVGYLQKMLLGMVDLRTDELSDVSSSSNSYTENEDMLWSHTDSKSSSDTQSSEEDDDDTFLLFPPGCLEWLNRNVEDILETKEINLIFMISRFMIHACLHQYKELLNDCNTLIQLLQDTSFLDLKDFAISCEATQLFCQLSLNNYEKVEKNFLCANVKTDHHFYLYGLSLLMREKWYKAMMMLARAINGSTEDDIYMAECHDGLGDCMINLRKHDIAMYHWQKAVELYQKLDHKTKRALVLIKIGKCGMSKNTDQTALQKLKEALLLQQQATTNERYDEMIADTMEEVAKCLKKMQKYDEANAYLEQSLEIYRNIIDSHVLVASEDIDEVDASKMLDCAFEEEDCLHFLMCNTKVVHYHVLLNCEALIRERWESCVNRFKQQLAECEWLPIKKAEACNQVGNCYAELNDPCKAVQWYKKETEYYTGDDASLADCLMNISRYLRENNQSSKAKTWGCKAVKTLQCLSNSEQDIEAKTGLHKKTADELFNLKRFEEAKEEYEKAIEQYKLFKSQWHKKCKLRSSIPTFESSFKYEEIITTSIEYNIVYCQEKNEKCLSGI